MKTLTLVRKAILLAFLLPLAFAASAQNNPINCDGKFFVSHGDGTQTTDPSSLEALTFASGGGITASSFVTNPGNLAYNAIGLNPIDGYMYALTYESSNNNSGAGGGTVQLIRVGNGGTNITNIGQVNSSNASHPLNSDVFAGCFDAAGNYYFVDNSNNFFKLTSAQLAGGSMPRTATYIADLSGSGNNAPPDGSSGKIIDIAINPVDGKMYGISMGSNSNTARDYRLYEISPSGALTRKGSSSGTAGQYPHTVGSNNYYVAALFFSEDGTLYGFRSNGTFLKMDVNNPNLSVSVGTGPSYTAADGCNCSFRVGHTIASLGFCPSSTDPNNSTNIKNIAVTLRNGSGAPRNQLTYTLDISDPKKRFRFTQSAATIAQNLFNLGLLPSNNAAQVILSTVAPASGTNYNKIQIKPSALATDGFTVPYGATSYSFTLTIQLYTFGGGYSPVSIQSVISGLPSGIGSTDLSGNGSQPNGKTDITFCTNLTLPVKLLSFSGSYKSNIATLNWESESEINFSYYQVERSINGVDFSDIALKPAQESGLAKEQYSLTDNLSYLSSDVFYYRLKMVDVDGRFSYSNVIIIRKEQKKDEGISVSPNPLVKTDMATIRVNAASVGRVEIRVIDMSGKIILSQQNRVAEGANSITLNNLDRLQSGIYTVQLTNGEATYNSKLSIIR
jgi:Secretion system C-terminal sorting domain